MENTKIKRTNYIYKEIENFKSYDLLVGIIYEMYIRALCHFKKKDAINNKIYSNDEINLMVNTAMEEERNKYKENILFTSKKYFNTKEKNIDQIILYETNTEKLTLDDFIYNLFPNLYNENINDNLGNNSLSIHKFIEMLNDENNYFNEAIFKDNNQNKYIKLTKEFIREKINSQLYNINKTFYMKYIRPTIYHSRHKIVNINNINLSMSNKEINHYLDKLREEITESDEKIFSLYDNEYIKVENNNKIDIETNIQVKDMMKNSRKMADLFFIYDVLELKIVDKKQKQKLKDYIKEEIDHNREPNEKSIHPSTIEKYYSLSKKLIHKMQYLYLYE